MESTSGETDPTLYNQVRQSCRPRLEDPDVELIVRLLPPKTRSAIRQIHLRELVLRYKQQADPDKIDHDAFIRNVIRRSLRDAELSWRPEQLHAQMQHNLGLYMTLPKDAKPVTYPETDAPPESLNHTTDLHKERSKATSLNNSAMRRRLGAASALENGKSYTGSWARSLSTRRYPRGTTR